MKKPNVAITGASGFIGHHLTQRILSTDPDAVVKMICRKASGNVRMLEAMYLNRVEVVEMDIRDADETTFVGVEKVYHLAAHKTTSSDAGTCSHILQENIEIDAAVFYALALRDDVKMLYATTGEVYGPLWGDYDGAESETSSVMSVDVEDTQWLYPLSKIVGEMTLRHGNFGFKTIIARLQNPYGPMMGDATLPVAIMRGLMGKMKMMVDAEATRPFLFIDDVVDALILLMESSIADLNVANVCGKETPVNVMAKKLAEIIGAPDTLERTDKRKLFSKHRALSTNTLQGLGWREWTTLDDGLRKTWEYYKTRI